MNPMAGCRCTTCPIIAAMKLAIPALRLMIGKEQNGHRAKYTPGPKTAERDRARAALAAYERAVERFLRG